MSSKSDFTVASPVPSWPPWHFLHPQKGLGKIRLLIISDMEHYRVLQTSRVFSIVTLLVDLWVCSTYAVPCGRCDCMGELFGHGRAFKTHIPANLPLATLNIVFLYDMKWHHCYSCSFFLYLQILAFKWFMTLRKKENSQTVWDLVSINNVALTPSSFSTENTDQKKLDMPLNKRNQTFWSKSIEN